MWPKQKSSKRHHLAIPMSQDVRRAIEPAQFNVFHTMRRGMRTTLSYDPHVYQDGGHALTDMEAFVNLLKCAFGTGCLAMPRAFYNAGWVMGLISTILISSFVIYAMHVLLRDIQKLCERFELELLNYRDTMELGILCGPDWLQPFRRPLAYLVDFFLCVYHFGVNCVYVIFIAKNLKHLGDIYLTPVDMRIYMALLTLPLLLTFLIRDLKYLVPFAMISNLFMFICFGIIFTYVFDDFPSLEDRAVIQPLAQYPLFFGTVLFAIESVGVIIALQRNMLNPRNYLGPFGVLNRAMVLVVVFYAFFGFVGYWHYGDETASSILNNLPQDEVLPQCVMAMFALGIFFSYALQGYVTVEIIWRHYMMPKLDGKSGSLEYLVRCAIVIASVLCAIGYPDFGLLLSFVGSFCLAQLGLIYPGIINLCLCYNTGYGPLNFALWRSVLFIIVGVVGGAAGTAASLRAMKDQYAARLL